MNRGMGSAGPSRRIAVLCEFGSVHGGENSLLASLAALRGELDPIILCPDQGRLASRLDEAGLQRRAFDVRDRNGQRRPADVLVSELSRSIAELQPDLVHANSLSMGRLTGRLARAAAIPCTAHLRDIIRLSPAAVRDLNGNWALFAVSQATADFHAAQGVDARKLSVLYNGVDIREFRPGDAADRRWIRRELKLKGTDRLAVTVGQIGLRKGLDVLAAAMPFIAANCAGIHFLIVGQRYSAKDEARDHVEQLRTTLARKGLADRVHWLGYRDDVAALLRGCDLLIHPARQEPFGRVLLEASASGLPIVATDVGGTREMLSDGESARLVASGDAAALAVAAVELLSDPAECARLGEAARRRIETRFGIESRAVALVRAWRAVLGDPGSQ